MATSDSEDFESADEELEVGSNVIPDVDRPESVPRRKNESPSADDGNGTDVIHSQEEEKGCGDVGGLKKPSRIADGKEKSDEKETQWNCTQLNQVAARKKLGTKVNIRTSDSPSTEFGGESRTVADSDGAGAGDILQSSSKMPESDTFEGWEAEVECDIDDTDIEDPVKDLAPVLDRLAISTSQKASTGWSSWGGWGSSLLTSASSLTSQVSQGLSSVLEAGIGAPDPAELALLQKQEKERVTPEQEVESSDTRAFGLGQLMVGVGSIGRLVENTGSRVLSGGLDTLETIGKKTMEVLQEGDPHLKRKRALLEGIALSQVLREAKQQAEVNVDAVRPPPFEILFDEYQGLVHLEALEMLSKQCDIKLQARLLSAGPLLAQLQTHMSEVKELCELPDEEEETDWDTWQHAVDTAANDLGVCFSTERLAKTLEDCRCWLRENEDGPQELQQRAVVSLAQLTAAAVEQYHRAAELLLVKEKRDARQEARGLVCVSSVLTGLVSKVANSFAQKASSSTIEPDNSLVTDIFMEAANSSAFLQQALQLMVPVLQVNLP